MSEVAPTKAGEAELVNMLRWKYAAELSLPPTGIAIKLVRNDAINGFTAEVTMLQVGSMDQYDAFDQVAIVAAEKAFSGALAIDYGGATLQAVARSTSADGSAGGVATTDDGAGMSSITVAISATAGFAVLLLVALLFVAHKHTGSHQANLATQRAQNSLVVQGMQGMPLPTLPTQAGSSVSVGAGGSGAINWNWDAPTSQQPPAAGGLRAAQSFALVGDGGGGGGWSDAAGVGAPSPDEYIALGTVERHRRAPRLASPNDSDESDGYTDVEPSAGISKFAIGRKLSSMKPAAVTRLGSFSGGNSARGVGGGGGGSVGVYDNQQHYFPNSSTIVEGDDDFGSTINTLQLQESN